MSTRTSQAPVPPDTDTHRVGIFAKAAQNLSVYNVTSRNFTDDGFYFYDRTCMTVSNVLATGNRRDGIVVSGGLAAGADECGLNGGLTPAKPSISGSTMMGNGAQQFDSEGGTEGNLIVTGNTIDGTGVTDYAMTGPDRMTAGTARAGRSITTRSRAACGSCGRRT